MRSTVDNNRDLAVVYGIIGKWQSFTEQWGGMFVRYLDGNPTNGSSGNVRCVHPREALAKIDDPLWTVNWPQPLTPEETRFVLENSEKFSKIFGADT